MKPTNSLSLEAIQLPSSWGPHASQANPVGAHTPRGLHQGEPHPLPPLYHPLTSISQPLYYMSTPPLQLPAHNPPLSPLLHCTPVTSTSVLHSCDPPTLLPCCIMCHGLILLHSPAPQDGAGSSNWRREEAAKRLAVVIARVMVGAAAGGGGFAQFNPCWAACSLYAASGIVLL